LDLGNVVFLSSTTLGLLVGFHKRLQEAGGRLIVTNVHGEIHEVFSVTKLDHVFEIRSAEPASIPSPGVEL
jgi:anti-anti-sigma factor